LIFYSEIFLIGKLVFIFDGGGGGSKKKKMFNRFQKHQEKQTKTKDNLRFLKKAFDLVF